MTSKSEITGKYHHYKGTEYEVIGIGLHTETEERLVIYQTTTEQSKIWLRPYDMFFETVTVAGKEIPRFKKSEE